METQDIQETIRLVPAGGLASLAPILSASYGSLTTSPGENCEHNKMLLRVEPPASEKDSVVTCGRATQGRRTVSPEIRDRLQLVAEG